jgi:hypothetical protein
MRIFISISSSHIVERLKTIFKMKEVESSCERMKIIVVKEGVGLLLGRRADKSR